ncbi:MAG TPA: HIT family protein [Acidimicrobiia bacterium]|nr:HIT family protein [Acidimicrobiia bacterium]
MPTVFTRIIEGDLPATFVWKDDRSVAFLSIEPLRTGHTLVVPRQEVDHWLDCPSELRSHLMEVATTIGLAIQSVWQPEKVGLMIAGLEVPHLHLHLVPIWGVRDLDFAGASAATREDLEAAAARMVAALESAGHETGIE